MTNSFEQTVNKLKSHAQRAAGNAHAPYSRFRVGAAVISASGQIYAGCNVENACFGLTQCAERAALTAAIADGVRPGDLQTLVFYTPGESVYSPCGACRQVMHELMAAESMVVACCDSAATRRWSHSEYLPDPFLPEALHPAGEKQR